MRTIERCSDKDGEMARVEERDDGFYVVVSRPPSARGPMTLVDALSAMNELCPMEEEEDDSG